MHQSVLPVLYRHVHRVIQEVADREGHEDVAGVCELVDEVISHVRCLQRRYNNIEILWSMNACM